MSHGNEVNSIESVEKAMCSGCSACAQSCPKSCIHMKSDEMGFLYPQIDREICNNCGRCRAVCPILQRDKKMTLSSETYSCQIRDEDILMKSSSGGLFYGLARWVLEHGGIVAGAAFDTPYRVVHRSIDQIEELDDLCRSKYVQSSMGDCYQKIKKCLQDGYSVLFVGTPCQTAGLYSYLRQENREKLLLVDFVCGTVYSPSVYKSYLEEMEMRQGCHVKAVNFREKQGRKWSDGAGSITFENGSRIMDGWRDNPYKMGCFHKLYSRPSCFQCQFQHMNSQSDITMGDMFLKKQQYTQEEEKGRSLAILKTEKGKLAFSKICRQYDYHRIGQEDMEQTAHLWKSHKENPRASVFKKLFLAEKYDSLEELILQCLTVSGRPGVEELHKNFAVFGGWNTRACLRKLVDDRFWNKMSYQISHSSLISLYAEPVKQLPFSRNGNAFRYRMACLDADKEYRRKLKEYMEKTDVLLVDFMEERCEICCYEDTYITQSDAMQECLMESEASRLSILQWTEAERMEKWKAACRRWIKDLLQHISEEHIVLCKFYLSNRKGHDGNVVEEYYQDAEWIARVNLRLEQCYRFFQEQCPQAKVIELKHQEHCYTDILHPYGCIPSHLNEEAYLEASEQLYDILVNENKK